MFVINKEDIDKLPFEPGQPHLFRSTDCTAFKSAIEEGKLWLRPDSYFREIEEEEISARADTHEGLIGISLFGQHGGVEINPINSSSVAEQLNKLPRHYILSFHGPNADRESISKNFKTTQIFGVKNTNKVIDDIFRYLSSIFKDFDITIILSQVIYFHYNRIYEVSRASSEESYILSFKPLLFFNPNAVEHLFVKRPYFGYQDEWRIVVLMKRKNTNEYVYINNDDHVEVIVDKSIFYNASP